MTFTFRPQPGGRIRADIATAAGEPHIWLSVTNTRGEHAAAFIPLDRLEEVIAGIRDMARQAGGNAPEPVRPPRPSHSRWFVETHDSIANEWAPTSALITRTAAVIKLEHLTKTAPTWRHDGSPVERRIVRETTTYTVEEAGA